MSKMKMKQYTISSGTEKNMPGLNETSVTRC